MIRYALSTEKSIRMMEAENKLVLIVDLKDNVKSIKEDVEKKLGAKVIKINTQVDSKGRKKAYVKFSEETPALDVATTGNDNNAQNHHFLTIESFFGFFVVGRGSGSLPGPKPISLDFVYTVPGKVRLPRLCLVTFSELWVGLASV